MTKKKTTESKEAVQQEVERRFKDVRTPDGISEVMRAAMLDMTTGKISSKTCGAIIKRAGEIIRALKQRLG